MARKSILRMAGSSAVPLLITLSIAVTGTVNAQEDWSTVKNKTYDIWVSPSFGVPPHQPFHDCARFTSTTITIDGCPSGNTGPLTEVNLSVPVATVWIGQVPCDGLDLVFFGTSWDTGILPSGLDMMGASGLATSPTSASYSYGMEGVRNENCTVQVQSSGSSPYAP